MRKVAIILAGGNGTRLWPLSTKNHPKPIVELFNRRTLLEETVFRAKIFADDIFIVTNKNVKNMEKDNLLSLGINHSNILVEPTNAETSAAIAFAIAKVKKKHGKNSVVVLLPVDHKIMNYGAFYHDILYTTKIAESKESLVLVGITPSFPSTGYGYVLIDKNINNNESGNLFTVKSFVEKPDITNAIKFLSNPNYVWNSGIYTATINTFESIFKINEILSKWYKSLFGINFKRAMPSELNSLKFEYGVIEKLKDKLSLTVANFDWADIGTYDELFRSSPRTDKFNNVINANAKIEDCQNCLIIGTNKPIIALGLNDIAIVDKTEGILVCQKSTHSQNVGRISTAESR